MDFPEKKGRARCWLFLRNWHCSTSKNIYKITHLQYHCGSWNHHLDTWIGGSLWRWRNSTLVRKEFKRITMTCNPQKNAADRTYGNWNLCIQIPVHQCTKRAKLFEINFQGKDRTIRWRSSKPRYEYSGISKLTYKILGRLGSNIGTKFKGDSSKLFTTNFHVKKYWNKRKPRVNVEFFWPIDLA